MFTKQYLVRMTAFRDKNVWRLPLNTLLLHYLPYNVLLAYSVNSSESAKFITCCDQELLE